MKNKIIIALALVIAIIFAGCISQGAQTAPQVPINEGAPEKAEAPSQEIPSAPAVTTASPQEEWCVPTKINYLSDPYVSVHSPAIIYTESSTEKETPVVTTLSVEDKYRAPLTGKIITLTKLGVPPQRRVTDLEFQTKATHSDGTVIYGDVSKVKELFDLQYRTIYNVLDDYTINKEGTLKLESRLKYKIDGVERVQCTAANSIPFTSSDSYSVPSFSNVKIGKAVSFTAQAANLNAKTNVTFDYAGIKPTSVELRTVSKINPGDKVYFTDTNLRCEDGTCNAVLDGLIDNERKELFCSDNALHYLQVSIGPTKKNSIVDLNANAFLKEFGGCPL